MSEEKISIVSDEISQDLDVVAKFAEENNIRTFELRGIGGQRVPDIDDALWQQLVARVRDDGWHITGMSPGIFKRDYRAKRLIIEQLEDVLPRTLKKAKEVGAGYIITFGFATDTKTSPPDHVLTALRDAADICADAGIPLLLKNEPGSFADSGSRTASLINRVGHPNLYSNWDPCNTNVFKHSELSIALQTLGRKVFNVHVKDGKPIPKSSSPMYGPIHNGELGWKTHLLELKKLGYDRYLTLETHYQPAYEASAELLAELRSLVREVNFF